MRKLPYPTPGDYALTRIAVHPLGCWEYTGRLNERGYGTLNWRRRQYRAHRAVYELLVGRIPDGLTIDHLCRNKRCVNPAHLEVVTRRENTLRQMAAGAHPTYGRPPAEHCPRGHAMTDENTYLHSHKRRCRTCERARSRASYLKRTK